MNNKKSGFTLVELAIVLGIIGLILGVVMASINASKNKALDAETKKTLSELALKAEGTEIAPGVMDYQSAFNSINSSSVLSELAAKRQVNSGEYETYIVTNEYALVFPLKKGGYYCVDSKSHATGREVTGLFETSTPKSCDTATRIAGGGGGGGGGGTTPPTLSMPSVSEYCGDSSYCTRVYSETELSSPLAQGGGLINKLENLLSQAIGSEEEPPVDGGGGSTVGISIGIDPDNKGNLISDYLASSVAAVDANGNDLTGSIDIQPTDATALGAIASGSDYDFSHTSSAFPSGGGGQFTGCNDPYAFTYSVTDGNGNTTTATHEYMTCTDVTFVNFDPLR